MIGGRLGMFLFTQPAVHVAPAGVPGQLLTVAPVPLRLIVVVPVNTWPLVWASVRSWVLDTVDGSCTDLAPGFEAGVVPWNEARWQLLLTHTLLVGALL